MTAAIAPSTFSPLPLAEGPALLNLLIVDDERAVREACREAATALGYRTTAAESAEHALRVIDAHNIDVVVLDLRLPGAGGLEVLRQLKKARPDIEVVVVTGHGTVESAVQAMKAGAYDYMTKPFSLEELRLLLARVASHLKLKTENRVLREKIRSRQGFGSIIGRAPEMDKLYRIIAKAAHSIHPGTGEPDQDQARGVERRSKHNESRSVSDLDCWIQLSIRCAFLQHERQHFLRNWRIPYWRERLPMERRRPILTQCSQVLGRAIAFVRAQAVHGEYGIPLFNHVVAMNFRKN